MGRFIKLTASRDRGNKDIIPGNKDKSEEVVTLQVNPDQIAFMVTGSRVFPNTVRIYMANGESFTPDETFSQVMEMIDPSPPS